MVAVVSPSCDINAGSDHSQSSSRLSAFGSLLRRVGSQRGLTEEEGATTTPAEKQQQGGMRGLLRKAHSTRELNSAPSAGSICPKIRSGDDEDGATTSAAEEETGGFRGLFRRAASLRGIMGERKEEAAPSVAKAVDLQPVLLMTDANHGKIVFQNLDESFHDELLRGSDHTRNKCSASLQDLAHYMPTEEDTAKLHSSFSAIHRSSHRSDETGDTCDPSSSSDEIDSDQGDEDFAEDEEETVTASDGLRSLFGFRRGGSFDEPNNAPATNHRNNAGERGGERKRTLSLSLLNEVSSPPLMGDDDGDDDDDGDEFASKGRSQKMGYMDGSYRNVEEQESCDDLYYDYHARDYPSLLESNVPLYTIVEHHGEDHEA